MDDTCYITYAADSDKDQTFFLWGLKQDILRRMLLPMGDITKVEARAFAAERGFQKVAVKKGQFGRLLLPDGLSKLSEKVVRSAIVSHRSAIVSRRSA